MKCLIGKKIGMTQVYDDTGRMRPVTILTVGPCVVTQVKKKEIDGVDAVQLGWGFAKKLPKPQQGHLKGLGSFRSLRQFRMAPIQLAEIDRGKTMDVSMFKTGEQVSVIGTSKGRGFQGVVKRHGFKGSPASHGHKDQLRMPGASGPGGLQRVAKGKRMGGRMGGARVTVKNLVVMRVDPAANQLWVGGAVPGARGSFVSVVAV